MREVQDSKTTLDTSREFQALVERWVNTKVSKEAIEQAIQLLNFMDVPVVSHDGKVIDDYRYSMKWSLEHPDLSTVKNPPRVACAAHAFIHQITSKDFDDQKTRDEDSCSTIRRYTATTPSNADIKSILTPFQQRLSNDLMKSATEVNKKQLNQIKQGGSDNAPPTGGCSIM